MGFVIASMHLPLGGEMVGDDEVLASFCADWGPIRLVGVRLVRRPTGHTRIRMPKVARSRPIVVQRAAMELLHQAALAAFGAFTGAPLTAASHRHNPTAGDANT